MICSYTKPVIFSTTGSNPDFNFSKNPLTSASLFEKSVGSQLNVYPHPIIKKARVNSNLSIQKVEVFNLLGAKVLEREDQGELDFTDLPSGYYIIKAFSEEGELVKRVQKN